MNFAIGNGCGGHARIIAVVAFAGQNEDQIAGLCELFGLASQSPASLFDDDCFGLARSPGRFFPFTHLGDRNNRKCHLTILSVCSADALFTGASGEADGL